MPKKYDLKTYDLSFTKGTIYKDLRKLGGNAYRDIKMSLTLGTSSDLVHYLKKYSKLFSNLEGNEVVTPLNRGAFSYVYLLEDSCGRGLVVKRSHDGWVPMQLGKDSYVSLPRDIIKIFFSDYDITPKSLRRDVYDYEKIIAPFWDAKRAKLEGRRFMPYLNMALSMVDQFMPTFTARDLYSKRFWNKLLRQKRHRNLVKLQKYLRSIPTQKRLIPEEERFIFYDAFSNSLQTIFIQEAVKGKKDIIPGKKMAFPFELIAAGIIPMEMPKLMIEHILRAIESFVRQPDNRKSKIKKIPDFRPLESYKVFPPTPCEIYFAETSNLVACYGKDGKLNVTFVDTHVLHEPEGDLIYKWTERRCWVGLFLNLRFWVRKALDAME